MYTRTIPLDPDVDLASLPAHFADCMRNVHARKVSIGGNCVTFVGGIFRFVDSFNVLVPFGFGEMTVDAKNRHVRYRVSFRQLFIMASVMALGLGIFILFESRSWHYGLAVAPGVWVVLAGLNFAIGIPRFESFLQRAIQAAPRLKQTSSANVR